MNVPKGNAILFEPKEESPDPTIPLPCPFCGSDNLTISVLPSGYKNVATFKIHHLENPTCTVSMSAGGPTKLIELWNKRI